LGFHTPFETFRFLFLAATCCSPEMSYPSNPFWTSPAFNGEGKSTQSCMGNTDGKSSKVKIVPFLQRGDNHESAEFFIKERPSWLGALWLEGNCSAGLGTLGQYRPSRTGGGEGICNKKWAAVNWRLSLRTKADHLSNTIPHEQQERGAGLGAEKGRRRERRSASGHRTLTSRGRPHDSRGKYRAKGKVTG